MQAAWCLKAGAAVLMTDQRAVTDKSFEHKGKARALGAAFLVIWLAGCYETEKPVIEKGEKIAIAGSFSCKNGITGKTEPLKVTEQSEGMWPMATFRYMDNKGETNLFRKLSNGMYLGQEKGKQGAYNYFYLDVVDKNTLIFLVPDLMSKAPYIDALVKKYNVETINRAQNVRLKGDSRALLDFFGAHDKSLLSAVVSCQRQ
jgi:hypothetical protein